VLQLLADHALGLEPGLVRVLGDVLWRPLADLYLCLVLEPAAATALDQRRTWRLLLLPGCSSWWGGVQQAPLEAARTALGRDGLDGEVLVKRGWGERQAAGAGGGCPLGAEGESSVGQGAAELAELMTHTLHQAWACGHPSAASALVAAVRSMAVMARCLPLALPTEQQALHAVPRLALLRHNALRHLAATLLVATAVSKGGGGAAAEAGLGGEAGSRGGGWLPLGAEGESSVGQGAAELAELMTHTLHQAWACGRSPLSCICPSGCGAQHGGDGALPAPWPCPLEQQALHAVPRLALLRHNALRHLAATLLVATAVYSPGLEAVSGAPVGLLEQALLLRHAAAACLQDQVQAQVAVLQELLGGLQGLSSLGVRARGAGAAKAGLALRKVINQVLHSLSRLGRVLVELLAPEPLVQVCSEVLGAVCSSVVGDVMAKADLGVEDCKELQLLLGPLATDCLTALLPGAPHSAADPAQDPQLSGLPLHLVGLGPGLS
ncbi:hypothetical protein QJQ45_017771, partial [Haematococcus lacustris]